MMTRALPRADADTRPQPVRRHPVARMCAAGLRAGLSVFAYASATIVGVGLIPALITFADRGTFLRWSNDLLDLLTH